MAQEPTSAPKLDPAATDETSANARQGTRKRRDPHEPAAVIGIGASAGGIAPLQQFFADMKPDTGLAFVVVMHLSPDFESELANVIGQKTTMPVTQVTEAVKVQPNHVYVIPPNHHLTFRDSMLELVPPQQQLGRRVTIDLFFRTLAQAYGQRAVCVIMSGSDSDGAIGLKHIRAQGGLTIAQNPHEAQFDSMPATAISTGMVDWVLPVAEMPAKLVEFVTNEHRMKLPPEVPEAEDDVKVAQAPGGETVSDVTRATEDEDAIGKVLADLRAQTGHDFSHYKRATILRRIARRLQVNSLETIPQYVEFLRTHTTEAGALLRDLLIGVTHFFRDREAFAALEAHVPQLFAGKKNDDELRVWVAGCATGEEAYSVAMLLSEHAERLERPPAIQVFATDIDDESIADARVGLYPSTIEADVSPERLRTFFVRDQGRYRVRKEIRERVLFASHNVLSDAPFSRCDLVSCRNLLIYLNGEAQKQAFDVFHFALKSGGLLFIGSAENHSQAQTLFAPVDARQRIFVRRSIPRSAWKLPAIPLRPLERHAQRPIVPRARPLPALTHNLADEAANTGPAPVYAGHTRREVLFGELHLRLLEQYGPPSVVVNDVHDIVHLSQGAGRYLQFVAGEPSANVAKVAHPALQIEVRTALFKAAQTKEVARGTPTPVELPGGDTEIITIEVRPMKAADEAAGFSLVLFNREDPEATPEPSAAAPAAFVSRDADDEIQFLKKQLATTVEQYEAANEELKASNEELQAMNEELRSATEELETSKEELQSVNEELSTVNHELKSNVEELSRANDELDNLMASTDIGTVFLDRRLRIQRFTTAAQKIFNLIPADLGRPISDITSRLNYEGFVLDAEEVLKSLHTVEREVTVGEENEWYLTRIAPYRTSEDRIGGVVATFVNVESRKRTEAELRAREAELRVSEERYRTLFNSMDEGFYRAEMIFDSEGRPIDLRFLDANAAFEKLTGWHAVEGRTIREFLPNIEQEWLDEYGRVAVTGQAGRREAAAAGLNGRWFDGFAFRVGDENSRQVAVLFTETTARKRAEDQLRASEERFRTIADNVPQVIWTNDENGDAIYFNRRWYDYTGLSYEESAGPGWQAIVHPDDASASIARWRQSFAKGEVFDAEYRLRGADGSYRWFLGRNVPLRTEGEVVSWFGTATDINDFKHAQALLGETEEKFRLLVEGTPDYAMFLLNTDNIITYWSAGAERVFQWTADEAVGQKGSIIFTPEDLAVGQDRNELMIALAEGSAPDRRWHVRKDGTRLWLDGFSRRLTHPGTGELRGFAKIAREATEQKMAEEKLRTAHEELEHRVVERTRDLLAMNKELERTMSQRQQLEKELLEISEREKRRIGEDLHDGVCQELTATAFFLKANAKRVETESAFAAKTLSDSADIVNRNVGLTRDLARGLQPADLKGAGLKDALRALATQACENTNMQCHFKSARGVRVPDDTVALHLYRVAQEAVKNAVKHSGAKHVLIALDRNKENICVSVQDDGKGFSVNRRSKGLGLHIMRYRANALGGELKIERRKTGGMDITCVIPLKK